MSTATLATGSAGGLGSGTPDDRQAAPTDMCRELVEGHVLRQAQHADMCRKSAANGRGERTGSVDALPADARQLAAEMPVCRNLGIHRPLEIKITNDRRRAKIKDLEY